MSTVALELIEPDWPAPTGVRALTTTRLGGVSPAPYDSLNLGDHVGDAPQAVAENRRILREVLPSEPRWLSQVHGCSVADAGESGPCEADAAIALEPGRVCAVLSSVPAGAVVGVACSSRFLVAVDAATVSQTHSCPRQNWAR